MTDSPLPHLDPAIYSELDSSSPVVALESTVITHGLPRPENLILARDMERIIRDNGAIPATVAVLDGKIRVGLSDTELERLANETNPRKISRRDFASAIIRKECGGTTVAGTLFAAQQAGVKVFATGGIGGVHDVGSMDISADLQALSDSALIVVCAGAKAILDLPATLEYLETMGVPVIGYGTDEFPAFYSRQSGLPVSIRLDSPKEVDSAIQQSRLEAHDQGIHGQALTPFLLSRMAELTGNKTLIANLALLHNNARLAALISRELFHSQNISI